MRFSRAFVHNFSNFFRFSNHYLSLSEINDGFSMDYNSLKEDWINVGQDIKKATKQFATKN